MVRIEWNGLVCVYVASADQNWVELSLRSTDEPLCGKKNPETRHTCVHTLSRLLLQSRVSEWRSLCYLFPYPPPHLSLPSDGATVYLALFPSHPLFLFFQMSSVTLFPKTFDMSDIYRALCGIVPFLLNT